MLHAQGLIRPLEEESGAPRSLPLSEILQRCPEEVPGPEYYRRLGRRGARLGPSCRWIETLWRRDGEALGRLRRPPEAPAPHAAHRLPLGELDACFQLFAAALPAGAPPDLLLSRLGRLRLFAHPPAGELWGRIALRGSGSEDPAAGLGADLLLLDPQGRVLAEMEDARVERFARQAGRALDLAPPAPAPRAPKAALDAVLGAASAGRRAALEAYLLAELAGAQGLSAGELDPEQPLAGHLDSLMAVELKTRIDADLGVELPIAALLDGRSLRQVSEELRQRLPEAGAEAGGEAGRAALLLDEIAGLSEAEAEAQLAALAAGEGSEGPR